MLPGIRRASVLVACLTALAASRPACADEAPAAPLTLTLDQAIEAALRGNFDVQASRDAVQGAVLTEDVARAQFHPHVTPSYSRGQDQSAFGVSASQRTPWTGAILTVDANALSLDPATTSPLTQHRSTVALKLKQPLLRGFGKTAATYDLVNAQRGRQGRERNLVLSQQRLIVSVAEAYYQVLQQRELVEVAAQSLERSQTLQRSSEARLEVGLASKLDVYRAQLQASQAEDARVRADAGLQTALEHFRTLLGQSPVDAIEPATVALPEPESGDALEPVEVLVARAREKRLELAEQRDVVQDAMRTETITRQNRLPQLDLAFNVTQFGSASSFNSAFSTADRRMFVGFETSYPLERTTDSNNHAQARLSRAADERNLRQTELNVEAEVRAAVRDLERLRQSMALQRQAVEVAEQQRRLAQLRYERGLASNFDVVDAEAGLVLARTALTQLLASYQVQRLDLKRKTGELTVPEIAAEKP